jgi:hypothetical protein
MPGESFRMSFRKSNNYTNASGISRSITDAPLFNDDPRARFCDMLASDEMLITISRLPPSHGYIPAEKQL